jgi:hypothetical protein
VRNLIVRPAFDLGTVIDSGPVYRGSWRRKATRVAAHPHFMHWR